MKTSAPLALAFWIRMLKSLVPLANFSFMVTSMPSFLASSMAPLVSAAGKGSSR